MNVPPRPPQQVLSPIDRLKFLSVIYTHPSRWWSLATGVWDDNRALLIRWNGDQDRPLGNPVSTGHPTWFVLPNGLHKAILNWMDDYQKAYTAFAWLNGDSNERPEPLPDWE